LRTSMTHGNVYNILFYYYVISIKWVLRRKTIILCHCLATAMTSSSGNVPRLSYWKLRCFILNVLPNTIGDRIRFTTVIKKVAHRYGTRAFLASPRNARNLTDVISVLLQSKRFRLIDVSVSHYSAIVFK